jgi:hypothetical protein
LIIRKTWVLRIVINRAKALLFQRYEEEKNVFGVYCAANCMCSDPEMAH